MRGTRWCWVRRRSPSQDARGQSRTSMCKLSSGVTSGSAGREGIEPSLRVLEARLVAMTLQPKWRLVRELNPSRPIDSGIATPVASRGVCTYQGVPGRSRTYLLRFRKPLPLLSATRTSNPFTPLGSGSPCGPVGAPAPKFAWGRLGVEHRGGPEVPNKKGVVRGSHPPPLIHSQPPSLDG